MYTLLGRAMLGLIVAAEFAKLHLAVLLPRHRSGRAAVAVVTPKAAAPVVVWLFGVVWLFWLRVMFFGLFALLGLIAANVGPRPAWSGISITSALPSSA